MFRRSLAAALGVVLRMSGLAMAWRLASKEDRRSSRVQAEVAPAQRHLGGGFAQFIAVDEGRRAQGPTGGPSAEQRRHHADDLGRNTAFPEPPAGFRAPNKLHQGRAPRTTAKSRPAPRGAIMAPSQQGADGEELYRGGGQVDFRTRANSASRAAWTHQHVGGEGGRGAGSTATARR